MSDGFVSIVGAGPWDPGLITLAAVRRLARAEVVVADYLVNPDLLLHAPADAEIVQRTAGPRGGSALRQPELNALLLERGRAGKYVVRLKGGDPCMFGRGAEEAQLLTEAGIGFEFVPGVSSPIAAPQAAGIPVTHRDHTPAVTFVSGYEAYDKAGLHVAWEHLARSAGTLVLMMSIKNARDNARRLIDAGRDGSTPAAVVRWGTRGVQRTVVATLATIADAIDQAKLRAPATLVVGDVVGLRETIGWAETRPFFGKRIVLTRGRGANAELAATLAEQGADVVTVRSIEVAAPDDMGALPRALANLDAFDGVLLSSPTAVTRFFDALTHAKLDARDLSGKVVAAVGSSTAAQSVERGVRPDIVATRAHSEGLVGALRDAGELGRKWLHPRAQHARSVLGDAVQAAGGEYTVAPCYQTTRPPVRAAVLRSLLPYEERGEGLDAICLCSGATARNFVANLDDALGEQTRNDLLGRAKLIAIGPVTAAAIEALGFDVAAVADQPDDAGLIEALSVALASG